MGSIERVKTFRGDNNQFIIYPDKGRTDFQQQHRRETRLTFLTATLCSNFFVRKKKKQKTTDLRKPVSKEISVPSDTLHSASLASSIHRSSLPLIFEWLSLLNLLCDIMENSWKTSNKPVNKCCQLTFPPFLHSFTCLPHSYIQSLHPKPKLLSLSQRKLWLLGLDLPIVLQRTCYGSFGRSQLAISSLCETQQALWCGWGTSTEEEK